MATTQRQNIETGHKDDSTTKKKSEDQDKAVGETKSAQREPPSAEKEEEPKWKREWKENIFTWGEKELQSKAGTRDKAQHLGEKKIATEVHQESIAFVSNRHAVYVCSMDPDDGSVWSSVIFADAVRVPEDTTPGSPRPSGRPPCCAHNRRQPLTFATLAAVDINSSRPFCDACADYASAGDLVSAFQASAYKQMLRVDTPTHISILKPPMKGDPLWKNASKPGVPISLNFLEFETRKRYRCNGVICTPVSENGLCMVVEEAFSTCPRYIQRRTIKSLHRHPSEPQISVSKDDDPSLPDDLVAFITSSDTFMIATINPELSRGADSSHRGGRPGFVRVVDKKKLLWGDYHGKGLFQTMGNVLLYPKAGVNFIDWENGHTLQISGRLTIDWKGEFESLDNSCRLITLDVEKWIFTEYASPFKWEFMEYSTHHPILEEKPFLKEAGKEICSAVTKWRTLGEEQCRQCELLEIREESADVKTFRFRTDKSIVQAPGQYSTFTIDVEGKPHIRSWTISSATLFMPIGSDISEEDLMTQEFEISVKKVGCVTGWLHKAQPGLKCIMHGVEGHFTLASSEALLAKSSISRLHLTEKASNWWKLLMLSAGIGVTPMISMLRGVQNMRNAGRLKESDMPDIAVVHSERDVDHICFKDDFHRLSHSKDGQPPTIARIGFAITRQSPDESTNLSIKAINEDAAVCFGHLERDFLTKVVPDITERVVFLCGPSTFMGAMSHHLREAGVPIDRIFTENFDY